MASILVISVISDSPPIKATKKRYIIMVVLLRLSGCVSHDGVHVERYKYTHTLQKNEVFH